jgi:hypothetical protein
MLYLLQHNGELAQAPSDEQYIAAIPAITTSTLVD